MSTDHGLFLRQGPDHGAEIDALAALLGGRVGLPAVLGDLNRQARLAAVPVRGARRRLTWDHGDRQDPRWWPQGITSSADAHDSGHVLGHRLLLVSWYAKQRPGDVEGGHGVRISVLDLVTGSYRHVLLVRAVLRDGVPGIEPVRAHAGGIVWHGRYLHVAATGRGLLTFDLDDLVRVPDHADVDTFGYRYVLPQRFALKAGTTGATERLRYSFVSLSRSETGPYLLVGEYGSARQTRRLARFALDPETTLPLADEDGLIRPLSVTGGGMVRTQGAVGVPDGTVYLSASCGPVLPGHLHLGRPGRYRTRRWGLPIGPEDLAWSPRENVLWTVTEHPGRRWIVGVSRPR